MRRFTFKDNVISFIIGTIIAIPICIIAVIYRGNKQLEQMVAQMEQNEKVRYIYETKEVPVPVEVEVQVPVPITVRDTIFISCDGTVYDTGFTQEEIDELIAMVHYEAGNQDDIGKRLVADSALNRVKSDRFPNTLHEVIYEHKGNCYQYSVAGSGVLRRGTTECTDKECEIVYEEIMNVLDENVIFFQRGGYHKSTVPLYQHGDHYFSGLEGV